MFWWFEVSTRPPPQERPDVRAPGVDAKGVTEIQEAGTDGASSDGLLSAPPADGSRSGALSPNVAISQAAGRESVADILADPDEDFLRVARRLARLVADPQAPRESREEALAHTLNLAAGNERDILPALVSDERVPDELAETILDDALNGSLEYQADLYLAALASRKSPEIQTKIREHLAFLTGGEDLGGDPAAWTEAVRNAKKEWAL